MIDLKVKEIGRGEFVKTFGAADDAMRLALRSELAAVGEEIVSRAQANAPKRTGIMAAKIIWFFGERKKGGRRSGGRLIIREALRGRKVGMIQFSAMPTGRVAHLVERGVSASFHQRPGRGKNQVGSSGPGYGKQGYVKQGPDLVTQGPSYRYPRTLSIAARPFFTPAVDSVGGAEGVNSRLQVALDRAAEGLNGGR